MLDKLVQSALNTGWLSVESEGLIRQVVMMRGYRSDDLVALEKLQQAIAEGKIRREGRNALVLVPLTR